MSSITCVSDEGEIMKNITKHKNSKVKLMLPNWVKNELLEYQKEKHIIINDFIESSIRKLMESTYKKGYRNKTIDYTLNYMTKIEVIREDRPLQEGEKTSSTEPTWKELWEAQRAARERRFKEEMEECCNY